MFRAQSWGVKVVLAGLALAGLNCGKGPADGPHGARNVPPAPEKFQMRSGALEPPATGVYHGAFPDIRQIFGRDLASDISAMERLAQKRLAWVQFESDWAESTEFPWDAVRSISQAGRTPYIRILPRSREEQDTGADPVYTMENFLQGHFDDLIRRWAELAKASGVDLVIEFGPEVNGNWYPWNGQWNGGGETKGYGDPSLADGPERFRDVYRRFIDIFRQARADRVTWFLHVDSQPKPREPWNAMAGYYPGDEYIDWIGVSVFGAQLPGDHWNSFTDTLDVTYNEIVAISPLKPVAIVEFAVTESPQRPDGKADWIRQALSAVKGGWYPHVKAVSYWHERNWIPDSTYSLRIDSSPAALAAYREGVAPDFFVSETKFSRPAN